MDKFQIFLEYFIKYGYFFLALIVFLEYLNLPGLPGGVIMPAAGFIARTGGLNFTITIIISIISGLLGSLTLYFLGLYLGKPVLDKLRIRYPKWRKSLDTTHSYMTMYGSKGLFISRIIPIARTLVSVVAGAFNVKFLKFTIYSTLGISLWNFVLIFSGYAFGHLFIK